MQPEIDLDELACWQGQIWLRCMTSLLYPSEKWNLTLNKIRWDFWSGMNDFMLSNPSLDWMDVDVVPSSMHTNVGTGYRTWSFSGCKKSNWAPFHYVSVLSFKSCLDGSEVVFQHPSPKNQDRWDWCGTLLRFSQILHHAAAARPYPCRRCRHFGSLVLLLTFLIRFPFQPLGWREREASFFLHPCRGGRGSSFLSPMGRHWRRREGGVFKVGRMRECMFFLLPWIFFRVLHYWARQKERKKKSSGTGLFNFRCWNFCVEIFPASWLSYRYLTRFWAAILVWRLLLRWTDHSKCRCAAINALIDLLLRCTQGCALLWNLIYCCFPIRTDDVKLFPM